MKKVGLLFACACLAACLLTGCGNDAEEVVVIPEVEDNLEDVVEDEPIGEDEVYEDENPEEGTVRSQLTNEWVEEEVAETRPITVMFPTDKIAQPQYNIGEAGVLYEIMAEGGISRMMGVIEGWQDMEKIGNIRSMREYYVYCAFEWDALVVHHGNIWYADEILAKADNIDGNADSANVAFYRETNISAPHNSFVTGEGVAKRAEQLGYSLTHTSNFTEGHFTFATKSEPNTLSDYDDAVDATYIDMSPAFGVDDPYFEYNEEDGLYYRFWYGGEEHVDEATGEQLSFKNIIIQNTYYEPKPDGSYLGFKMHDNTRDGWYFTNGKGIHITWAKSSDYGATKYYDDDGYEIKLNTGSTMIFVTQEDKTFNYH